MFRNLENGIKRIEDRNENRKQKLVTKKNEGFVRTLTADPFQTVYELRKRGNGENVWETSRSFFQNEVEKSQERELQNLNRVHTSILLCPQDDMLSKTTTLEVHDSSPNKWEYKKMYSKVSNIVH